MRIILIALLTLVAVSCAAPRSGEVTHVVICWLKSPGDEAARQKIIDETATLKQIPGVVSVATGRAIPSTRPIVESSYDVGIVITLKDQAALRAYETNPIHLRARDQVLRPLAGKLIIYDIDSSRAGKKEEAGATAAPASGAGTESKSESKSDGDSSRDSSTRDSVPRESSLLTKP